MAKVEVTRFTDPYCFRCWATEPVLYRLRETYRDQVPIRFVMASLVRDMAELCGSLNRIRTRAQVAPHWRMVSERSGQPIDERRMEDITDPHFSTWLACRAVKAAFLQAEDGGSVTSGGYGARPSPSAGVSPCQRCTWRWYKRSPGWISNARKRTWRAAPRKPPSRQTWRQRGNGSKGDWSGAESSAPHDALPTGHERVRKPRRAAPPQLTPAACARGRSQTAPRRAAARKGSPGAPGKSAPP